MRDRIQAITKRLSSNFFYILEMALDIQLQLQFLVLYKGRARENLLYTLCCKHTLSLCMCVKVCEYVKKMYTIHFNIYIRKLLIMRIAFNRHFGLFSFVYFLIRIRYTCIFLFHTNTQTHALSLSLPLSTSLYTYLK